MNRKILTIIFVFCFSPLFSQVFTEHQNLGKRMIQSSAMWMPSFGRIDLIVTGEDMNNNGSISTYYYKQGAAPNRKFTITQMGLPNLFKSDMDIADFNIDGLTDVVIMGMTAQKRNVTDIYTRLPNGNFKVMEQNLIPLSDGSVQFGDFDNDDDIDMLICGRDGGGNPRTIVYSNEYDSLSVMDFSLYGIFEGQACWGDINNDDNLDIILTGNSTRGLITKIFVYNEMEGRYKPLNQNFVGLRKSKVSFADFNNDGQLDFVITGLKSDGYPYTRIFRGNGNMTFTDVTNGQIRELGNASLDVADFDADGDMDFIIAGESLEKPYTILYENAGNFIFRDYIAGLPAVYDGIVKFGDFDKDGDMDLYITGVDDCNEFFGAIFRNNLNPPVVVEEEEILWEPIVEITRGPYYYFVFSSCFCDLENTGEKSYNVFVSNIHKENKDFELNYKFNGLIINQFPSWGTIDAGHRTSNAFVSISDAEEGRNQVLESYKADNFKIHYINW